MFRSLCNTLIRGRIINGGDLKPLSICSQNPSFLLLFHINKVRFVSSSSIDQTSGSSTSFVVSYLMNSCGLTEKQALSASKKLNFKTTSKPDTVVRFLESYGFTKPDISKLIIRRPVFLLSDTHKTLKPKLDYFNSKEISRLEVAKVLSSSPNLLKRNLEKYIIPAFDFIKNIVGTDRDVFAVLQRSVHHFLNEKVMMLNMQVLRDEGVPQSNIVKHLINQPTALMISTGKLKDIVQEVKGMGFDDPYNSAFLRAIQAFTSMTKSTWEKKMNAYGKWGWSEEQILNAFRLQQKDQISTSFLLAMSKKSFLEKFVIKYEQQAPELSKVKELS